MGRSYRLHADVDAQGARPVGRQVRAAWVWVATIPIAFVVGLICAYVIEGVLAPDTLGPSRSLASDVLGAAVVTVLVGATTLAARRAGRLAQSSGDVRGRWVRHVAAVVGVAALIVVLGQLLVNVALGRY